MTTCKELKELCEILGKKQEIDDKNENLRLDYEQTVEYIKLLTDIRFRLLVFTPVVSGITIILSEYILKNSGADLLIGVLGFIATFGIIIYDQRNSEIYNGVVTRAGKIEEELNFSRYDSERKHGGLFNERTKRSRKLLGMLAWHDRGLALVYSASLSGWSFLIIYSISNIIIFIISIYCTLPEIYTKSLPMIFGIGISMIFGKLFFDHLQWLDRSPEYAFEFKKIQKVEFFKNTLNLLQNDWVTIFEPPKENNGDSTQKMRSWASLMLLIPIVEDIAHVVGEKPQDFLGKHLEIAKPYLAWDMFRNSLGHSDYLKYAKYDSKEIKWEITSKGTTHAITNQLISIDTIYLYKKLITYLEDEINKGDRTKVNIKAGIIYNNPKKEVREELSKL